MCPLLINTPGWIQGTGLDLLVSLITDLRPSEVIYMSQTGPADAVEALHGACKSSKFTMLPSQTAQYASRSAAQLRSMHAMSYFHADPQVNSEKTISSKSVASWVTLPLTHVRPWQVSYEIPDGGVAGVMCYDYQASPALLADAINGTILAAVEIENNLAFRGTASERTPNNENEAVEDTGDHTHEMDVDEEAENSSRGDEDPSSATAALQKQLSIAVTPEGLPFIDAKGSTLDPRYSRFIGLVLVRGIDVQAKCLQLLSPITTSQIDAVAARSGRIVLISGKLDAPAWAYTEDSYYQSAATSKRGVPVEKRSIGAEMEVDGDEYGEASDDSISDMEEGGDLGSTTSTPWIEVLRGSQKRGIGSKVWRVRRDLGRNGNAAE